MVEPKEIEGYKFDKPYMLGSDTTPYDVETGKFTKEEGMWYPEDRSEREGYDHRHLICKCGGTSFKVFFPESYSTCVQCVSCGNQKEVHSG